MSENADSLREQGSGPQDEQVWHGIFPIVQLPWDSDENIDYPVLKREIDWLVSEGCRGLVVGMVTEAHRLTDIERDQLNEKLVEYAANRVPVVASVGDESSRQACRHTRAAESAGAS
ncbi:MAG: dihydrodipicolinate synthase family protein, partial [Chthoniobacterales bacterium]